MNRLLRSVGAALIAVATLPSPVAADDILSAKGRALFNGTGEDVAHISARIAGRTANAARLPCASCHGRDGLGRKEANVLAPPIVRGDGGLDRAGRTPAGGIRPAYDRASFAGALAGGIASDGRMLSERMPRYDATSEQIDALWTWLEQVGAEQRQGVTDDRLVLSAISVPGLEPQAERVATALRARIDTLPPRFGRRITLRAEVWRPGADDCPGAQALALIVAGLDAARSLLDAARRCAVPAMVPFHDLAGNENPLDVRGMSAPLVQQWRALRRSVGAQAVTLLPGAMSAWESAALRFAGIGASQEPVAGQAVASGRAILFLPFGLDRSPPPQEPAVVVAPLSGSFASYTAWLQAGHELHLALAAPSTESEAGTDDAIQRRLADLIDQASLAAGPAPTRAAFVEAIDRAVPRLGAGAVLDYSASRLTGTRNVVILKSRP